MKPSRSPKNGMLICSMRNRQNSQKVRLLDGPWVLQPASRESCHTRWAQSSSAQRYTHILGKDARGEAHPDKGNKDDVDATVQDAHGERIADAVAHHLRLNHVKHLQAAAERP